MPDSSLDICGRTALTARAIPKMNIKGGMSPTLNQDNSQYAYTDSNLAGQAHTRPPSTDGVLWTCSRLHVQVRAQIWEMPIAFFVKKRHRFKCSGLNAFVSAMKAQIYLLSSAWWFICLFVHLFYWSHGSLLTSSRHTRGTGTPDLCACIN